LFLVLETRIDYIRILSQTSFGWILCAGMHEWYEIIEGTES